MARKMARNFKKFPLRAAYNAANMAAKLYRARKTFKYKSAPRDTAPVTAQHEYTTVYRKKRMPSKRKKAWKRFVRKTQAVNLKEAPLRSFVHAEANNIYAAANQCGFYAVSMYGDAGPARVQGTSTSSGKGSMNQMQTLISNVYSTTATARKIRMESACNEITLKNISGTNAVVVEMYYFKARKHLESDSVIPLAVEDYYADGFNSAEQGFNVGAISAVTHGTTPFQSTLFTRHFKIWKKVRVQLGGGEVASFQIRDPRNHLIQTSDVVRYAANPRRFQGIFFQIYGQPDTTGYLTINGTTSAAVKVMTQQVYNWREIVAQRTGVAA